MTQTVRSASFNHHVVDDSGHRPWAMPRSPWLMTQSWHDLLFAHWRVDVAQLRAAVPTAFDLDLFEGEAWLGIVPFYMTNVSLRGVPPLPWVSAFAELNVRTYVRVAEKPGVYFFSLDAARWLAVAGARALFNLPYYTAAMTIERQQEARRYQSLRGGVEFKAVYRPTGPSFIPSPGSLDYFLTERYCLYNLDHHRRPYRMDIHHPPWSLHTAGATIETNTMVQDRQLILHGEPELLHFARRQDVVVWAPARL